MDADYSLEFTGNSIECVGVGVWGCGVWPLIHSLTLTMVLPSNIPPFRYPDLPIFQSLTPQTIDIKNSE